MRFNEFKTIKPIKPLNPKQAYIASLKRNVDSAKFRLKKAKQKTIPHIKPISSS